ncbi:MAG: hypothetical protein ACOX3V_04775 [Bacillota bacterium]|jgi:hypothetical protein
MPALTAIRQPRFVCEYSVQIGASVDPHGLLSPDHGDVKVVNEEVEDVETIAFPAI